MNRSPKGTARETIVLDFDGTLVEGPWPEIGNWMPGAIEAVKRLHAAGYHLVVDSCRLHTMEFETAYINQTPRNVAERQASINEVRDTLDKAGLRFVEVYTGHGKPPGIYYIDDKGERYMGHVHSWKRLVDKILLREGKLDLDLSDWRNYCGNENCRRLLVGGVCEVCND